jgi:divalent metal cation (Fe/Co/Zn/Cd) transporter
VLEKIDSAASASNPLNLRENGLPVEPLPDAEGRRMPGEPAKGEIPGAQPARGPVPPSYAAIRALILAISGVLTGSQALVAGACFFLALAVSKASARSLGESFGWTTDLRAPVSLFFGALILSMSAGLAGHNLFLVQSGIALNNVNPFGLLVAVVSLFLTESQMSVPSAVARWIFPSNPKDGSDPELAAPVASFLVLVGVLANVAHLTVLDPFAAILVAGLVFRTGWRMIVDA